MSRYDKYIRPALYTVSLWYFLAHTAVFARLWAELLEASLAQGGRMPVLCMLPLLAGLIYLREGQRFYARAGRYAEAVLFVLAAAFVWVAGVGAPIGLSGGTAYSGRSDEVFAGIALGRMGIVPALLCLAALFFVAAAGIRCVRAIYKYLYQACVEFYRGRTFRERQRSLESRESRESRECQGSRESWEIWGSQESGESWERRESQERREILESRKCQRNRGRWERTGWRLVVLLLYVLTVGFTDAFTAVVFYRSYNLQILAPALFAVWVALVFIRARESRVRESRQKTVVKSEKYMVRYSRKQ